MILHFSDRVRNARSQAIEDTIGASPFLDIYDDGGAGIPANCAATLVGTKLAHLPLPADWKSAPSGGISSMVGTWQASAIATGTAKYYVLTDNGGTNVDELGDITATGGGGALTVASTAVTAGDDVEVTSYSQTEGNA